MKFKERTTAPAKTNKNYYSKNDPFYPAYTDNCTWYAWGRELELGTDISTKKMPTSNAENWYKETKYSKYQIPRTGDIGCYRAGAYHKASDGEGHVFVVEKVYSNNTILISESGANMKFKTRTLAPPYKFYLNVKHKSNYKFEGFIHLKDYDIDWELGTYATLKEKYIRETPEVKSNNKVKYKDLSAEAKKKCKKDVLGYAKYKKGALVDITEFKYDNKANLWGKTKNTWLCVKDSTGNQVKKK